MSKRILSGPLMAAVIAAAAMPAAAETANISSAYPVVVGQAGVTDGDTIRMGKAIEGRVGRIVKVWDHHSPGVE